MKKQKVTLFYCCRCKDRVIKDLKKLKGVDKVEPEGGYLVVTGQFKLDDILEEAECSNHSSLKCWEDITPKKVEEKKPSQVSLMPDKFSFPGNSNNMVVYINNMVVHYHPSK